MLLHLCFTSLLGCAFQQAAEPYKPQIDPASDDAQRAIARFQTPKDCKVSLWAAEPMLANPVAFCFDDKGRVYVAETFRLHAGVTDNRNWSNWIDEELACRTVADREAMYRRRFKDTIADWQREHERVQLLTDSDGDGKADRSVVFAQNFRHLADGIGAGLLAYRGDVYYTCIPKLWKLSDTNSDGRADSRVVLHQGYGVHTSLLGHDLHGLRIGPDGKLYFSIGDRGFHIVLSDGRTLDHPDEGAVLRCNLDGSELEVVHRGLRNPQELAFDRFGNLFTGDNNSDGGDQARWVYVVEGGNSGWCIGYQSIPDRGPWNREKLWYPQFPGQAAYIVPPIDNFTNGPSGLTYDPGVGLPERYRDRFFLCDFRGSSAVSGVWALESRPRGAGFELASVEQFWWRVLATDVEFGIDGSLWISDWTEGWEQPHKGRLYRLTPKAQPEIVARTAELLRTGMDGRSLEELERLLGHPDMRVRQRAQFALVDRGAVAVLTRQATKLGRRMARIHAIWGLGQIGRSRPEVLKPLLPLLDDFDVEVRCQTAKVFGWGRFAAAGAPLVRALRDRSDRVRFFAAQALGKLGFRPALEPLLDVLRENHDEDRYLRHAAVMGLTGIADIPALLTHADDPSSSVRMGILLVLRRLERPEIAAYLEDPDPLLVVEAARAIHDVPIAAALPELAGMLNRRAPASPTEPDAAMHHDAIVRRALAANNRIGDATAIDRMLRFASRADVDRSLRAQAIELLGDFAHPKARDPVVNLWRPIAARSAAPVAAAFPDVARRLLEAAPDRVRVAVAQASTKLGVRQLDGDLERVARSRANARVRRAALAALEKLESPRLVALATDLSRDRDPDLRGAGIALVAAKDPEHVAPLLSEIVSGRLPAATGGNAEPVRTTRKERQNAMRVLGDVASPAADRELSRWMDELSAGKLPAFLELELLEAVEKRHDEKLAAKLEAFDDARDIEDPVADFRECLFGGDREAGSAIFHRSAVADCRRCHEVSGGPGPVAPDLAKVGTRLTRRQILEALIDPSRTIVAGYGTVTITKTDATVVTGVFKGEKNGSVLVQLPDKGGDIEVPKAEIRSQSQPVSAMPAVGGKLSKGEIRNLVEFLTNLGKKK